MQQIIYVVINNPVSNKKNRKKKTREGTQMAALVVQMYTWKIRKEYFD